ncbi:MAG: Crp/Fnr family transcriptional regulator [Cyanobacteria bacterium P01_D01_bin.156]
MEPLDSYLEALNALVMQGIIDVRPSLLFYKAGEIIFHADEQAQSIFAVQTGQVQLVQYLESGQMVHQYTVQPSMWFGEDSLFQSIYQSSAIATQPSQIIAIPNHVFLKLLHHETKISLVFIKQLTEQLQITKNVMTLRCIRSAYNRVLTYLHTLTSEDDSTVVLRCSIKEIAAQICLTPEVVSRSLRKLQDNGVIQRYQRRIIFLPREQS